MTSLFASIPWLKTILWSATGIALAVTLIILIRLVKKAQKAEDLEKEKDQILHEMGVAAKKADEQEKREAEHEKRINQIHNSTFTRSDVELMLQEYPPNSEAGRAFQQKDVSDQDS